MKATIILMTAIIFHGCARRNLGLQKQGHGSPVLPSYLVQLDHQPQVIT